MGKTKEKEKEYNLTSKEIALLPDGERELYELNSYLENLGPCGDFSFQADDLSDLYEHRCQSCSHFEPDANHIPVSIASRQIVSVCKEGEGLCTFNPPTPVKMPKKRNTVHNVPENYVGLTYVYPIVYKHNRCGNHPNAVLEARVTAIKKANANSSKIKDEEAAARKAGNEQ